MLGIDLPRWYLSTPEGSRIAEQSRMEQQANRERLVAELEALDAEGQKQAAAAQARIAKAQAAFDKAEAAWRAAGDELAKAQHQDMGESFSRSGRRARLERELIESADPQIAAFVAQLNEEADRTRRTRIEVQTELTAWGLSTRQRCLSTNRPSIDRRLDAIAQARQAAEGLKLSAATNVAEQLEALWASLPPVQSEPVQDDGWQWPAIG